ncbi:MAG: chorismate synthase [Actinobacteria bacterium]|jgi:chorismate synthase|uniref:chorismate synthase n=1 Tax=freshwater metagenome TaxID=449393 RepID=A0A6J6D9D8_9ZZZZ|nr:chorismate synthase [Actinomycetota bacterium]
MRWLTAGESHGPALTGIIEGIPAGVPLTTSDIQSELGRRRLGFGRGARQKFEEDQVTIKSGVRHGVTQGGPIAIEIANSEWPKWEKVMASDPVDPSELQGLARNEPLSRPRPGHADLVGMQKYGFTDARPILERASARETAMRVALSVVARQLLREVASTEIFSHVIAIGKIDSGERTSPSYKDRALIDESPVRAAWSDLSAAMVTEIEEAHREGDTLGGVFEVVVENCPIGLGSHVHWDRRIDSRLAAAIMGIQAIKGVEIGDGFASAARRGSAAHDEIEKKDGSITRLSNRSGGTEGGMTTGERLRVRGAMKPISTVPKALATIDVTTGESAKAINQRSDVCAVPAAGVIGEAMVALVLAEALLEKFGGDHIEETKRNFRSFMENISVR